MQIRQYKLNNFYDGHILADFFDQIQNNILHIFFPNPVKCRRLHQFFSSSGMKNSENADVIFCRNICHPDLSCIGGIVIQVIYLVWPASKHLFNGPILMMFISKFTGD